MAHESSFQLGFTLGVISIACYVAVTALSYQLFEPVNRSLALLAVFFSLVGCAAWAFAVRGVNAQRWHEQASAAVAPILA